MFKYTQCKIYTTHCTFYETRGWPLVDMKCYHIICIYQTWHLHSNPLRAAGAEVVVDPEVGRGADNGWTSTERVYGRLLQICIPQQER